MEDMNDQQPPMQPEDQQQENNRIPPPPQQPPPKCPRCDSVNTKFCYYNNYSFTQPRYFCKTCRRYWTQGGTLRNVPVGGGCRRGSKRSRAAASSSSIGEASGTQPSPPLALPQLTKAIPNLAFPGMAGSYFPVGGGVLTSLAPMQSLRPPPGFNTLPFNVSSRFGGCNTGGGGGGGSNLALLQGFNNINPSFNQQQNNHQLLQSDQQILVQPNRPIGSWTQQGFINNPNASSTTSTVAWTHHQSLQVLESNTNIPADPSSMNNPNQWPDDNLPGGYGPPPPA